METKDVKEVGESVKINALSFLSSKPVWVYWIVYCLLCAVLFGVFYTAMYFMALQWWIPVIIVIASGLIWGSIAYTGNLRKLNKEEDVG